MGSRAVDSRARRAFAIVVAIGIYAIWVFATWLFEGRTHLFDRYDPSGRALYALVANVLVGTVAALAASESLGMFPATWRRRSRGTTTLAVVVAFVLGGALATGAAHGEGRDPRLLANAFVQVLPTSIAEVAVCAVLLGGAVRKLSPRPWSALVAIVIADAAFALYHVAHSPPFDEPRMMLFLAIPGLLVSAMAIVARNVPLAIVVQNWFAVVGITKNADPATLRHPFLWAYALAAVAVGMLAVMSWRGRARALE